MNKKFRFRMAAVLILCCLLAACGSSQPSPASPSSEVSPSSSEASSPSSEASSALPESSSASSNSLLSCELPSGVTYAISHRASKHPQLSLNIAEEPPGYEKQPAPDFLTKEQQDVYKKAERLAPSLLIEGLDIDSLYLSCAEGQDKVYYGIHGRRPTVDLNGANYYEITSRYRRWDDLYAVMTSIFEEYYYNDRWGDRFIPDQYGNTLALDSARGTNREWKYDTYELVSRDDGTVAFNVLGHCQKDDGTTYINPVFIKMINGPDGWRITQFDITH